MRRRGDILKTLDQPDALTGWPLDPDTSDLARLIGSEAICHAVSHGGRAVGVLATGNKYARETDPTSGDIRFLQATADSLGLFHENLARFENQRDLFFGTLRALTSAIDAKDHYTCGHSERVAWLGGRIAAALGLPPDVQEQARIAGLVHDVGKIGVPESALRKAGRLSDEEFEQIKRHPVIGHDMLRGIAPLAAMLPGVLYHHERWDGKGYPEGRAGDDIPLLGRILAVADTFDAMSSTRTYRTGLSRATVLAELSSCAGRQFDRAVVEALLTLDLSGYDHLLAAAGAPTPIAA